MAYDTTSLQKTKDIYSSVLNYYGDTIQLGILDIDYLTMVTGALTTNSYFNFDTVNNTLSDIIGRPTEPYSVKNIFTFAPLFHQSNYCTVTFKIDPAYLFKDANNTIYYTSTGYVFQIDFGDGNGFIPINPTSITYYTVNYPSPGNRYLTAQITHDGVLMKSSTSSFKMGKTGSSGTPPDAMLSFEGINVGVYHGCTDDANRKVVIYLEGIDMLDFSPMLSRDVKQIYDGMIKSPKIAQLKNFGYDFYVVDWWNSREPMQDNAMRVVRLIDYLKGVINNNFQFVVIGESMGGVVARYALTYMESPGYTNPTYWPYANRRERMHNTRLLITFDSPHQGANLPMSLQLLYTSIYNPLVLFGAPMFTNFIADNFDKILYSTAAKQLLIYHISTGGPNYGYTGERAAFLSDLANLGNYPQYCKLMAISNGALDGEMQTRFYSFTDRTPNDHLLNFSQHLYVRILWFVKIGIGDFNLDLRTNPSGSGTAMHLDIGIVGITVNFYFFGVSLFSTYNPIVYIDADVNVKPFCVNQGGYFIDGLQQVVGNSQSNSSIDLFSNFWLLDLFSWHSASDGNGCWSGASHIGLDGFASVNFDLSVCSDGMHFCFVPTQSALDYGNIYFDPINNNIETAPITTKMSSTPFDVIVGNASIDDYYLGTHNLNRSHLYEKYEYEVSYPNGNTKMSTDFKYCDQNSPTYGIYGHWINREIGDYIMYLDNLKVNWKSTIESAEFLFGNTFDNPYYEYVGIGGGLMPGFYSKSNPFQILGSNSVDFQYDYPNPTPPLAPHFIFNVYSGQSPSATWTQGQGLGLGCSTCQNFSKRSLLPQTKSTNQNNVSFVNIFPNPNNTGLLIANYKFEKNRPVTIIVTDIVGKKLFERSMSDIDNSGNVGTVIQLKENKFSSGLYIITISNGIELFNSKLIIE